MKTFEDVLEIKNGKNQRAVEDPNGKYPIYGSGGIMGYANDYICRANTVIIGRKGNINKPIYVEEPFWNVDTAFGLEAKIDILLPKYLYYFCLHYDFERLNKAVTIPSLTKADLLKIELELPAIDAQAVIVDKLGRIEQIIALRKQELQALDNLIKARFVEMFGDPLAGSAKWPIHTVEDVAEAIDPQPSHRTPPIDESGIPYISTKDCDYKTGVIDFEHARKVGRNVLEEHLQRYELHVGDFIIGKIGTIGNPIFVPARKDYTLSANIVLIQPDKKKVSPYFLKYSFMSAFMDKQFEEAKNSTSQAAFGIQKVRMIKVMDPAMEVQLQFESFAKQVDKSKIVVQKALDKAQVLFDCLMQQYFG